MKLSVLALLVCICFVSVAITTNAVANPAKLAESGNSVERSSEREHSVEHVKHKHSGEHKHEHEPEHSKHEHDQPLSGEHVHSAKHDHSVKKHHSAERKESVEHFQHLSDQDVHSAMHDHSVKQHNSAEHEESVEHDQHHSDEYAHSAEHDHSADDHHHSEEATHVQPHLDDLPKPRSVDSRFEFEVEMSSDENSDASSGVQDSHSSNSVEDSAETLIFKKLFKGLKSVFKKALKTLRGLNCTVKSVFNVRSTAQQLIDDVHACGEVETKEMKKVIDSCTAIINTANEIVQINESVCQNSDYSDATDGSQKPSKECRNELQAQLLTLRSEIKATVKLIKMVPANADSCLSNTITACKNGFNEFSNAVRECPQSLAH